MREKTVQRAQIQSNFIYLLIQVCNCFVTPISRSTARTVLESQRAIVEKTRSEFFIWQIVLREFRLFNCETNCWIPVGLFFSLIYAKLTNKYIFSTFEWDSVKSWNYSSRWRETYWPHHNKNYIIKISNSILSTFTIKQHRLTPRVRPAEYFVINWENQIDVSPGIEIFSQSIFWHFARRIRLSTIWCCYFFPFIHPETQNNKFDRIHI